MPQPAFDFLLTVTEFGATPAGLSGGVARNSGPDSQPSPGGKVQRKLAQPAGGPVRRHRPSMTGAGLLLTTPNTGPHSWPAGPLLGTPGTPVEHGQEQPGHDRRSHGADQLLGHQTGEEVLIEVGEGGRNSGGDHGPTSSLLFDPRPAFFLLPQRSSPKRRRSLLCPRKPRDNRAAGRLY
jgi:hypothetical protein